MANGRDGPCKNSLRGMRKKLLDDIIPKSTISLSGVTEPKIKRETASNIRSSSASRDIGQDPSTEESTERRIYVSRQSDT